MGLQDHVWPRTDNIVGYVFEISDEVLSWSVKRKGANSVSIKLTNLFTYKNARVNITHMTVTNKNH